MTLRFGLKRFKNVTANATATHSSFSLTDAETSADKNREQPENQRGKARRRRVVAKSPARSAHGIDAGHTTPDKVPFW